MICGQVSVSSTFHGHVSFLFGTKASYPYKVANVQAFCFSSMHMASALLQLVTATLDRDERYCLPTTKLTKLTKHIRQFTLL